MMRLILPATLLLIVPPACLGLFGCAASPPAFVRAEISRMTPPHRDEPIATISDRETAETLARLLSPGVGSGHRSRGGVGGIVTHRIRFTREDGRVDVVDIYNRGAAWSEGRGDWLLDEPASEKFRRIVAAASARS